MDASLASVLESSSESGSEERQRAQQLERQRDAEEERSGEKKQRAEGMGVGVTGAGWKRTDKKCSLRYAGLWEDRVRVRRVRSDHRTPWKEHNRD
jgi:hypothetical protein